MKNLLIYYFLKTLSLLLFFVPRKILIFKGKIIGSLLFNFFPVGYKILNVNLSIAFPKLSKSEKSKLIRKIYKHYSIVLLEFFKQKSLHINNTLYYFDKKTESILEGNDNFILMTAHMGNWELFLPIINSFRKITAIVKEQKNKGADNFIVYNRSYDKVTLVSNKESIKKMYQPLINNDILLIVNDQNPKSSGSKVDFFNVPVLFPKGAGHFYNKAKCKVIIGFCLLRSDYRYELKLREINLDKNLNDKHQIIDNLNFEYSKLLEQEILLNPEQYCWFYKKWDKKIYK